MALVELKRPLDERAETTAAYLREIADKVESGAVTEMVLIANEGDERHFEAMGHFDDRWRLLGALEYAKASVHNS